MNNVSKTKQLEDIHVMYVEVTGPPPEAAPKAFARLEKVVPLQGNKFFGVYNAQTNSYRACAEIKPGEHNPEALGLSVGVIPGGLYAYEKLEGQYRDIIKKVGPTFDSMAKSNNVDPDRPFIESYRRFSEFILYVPIK